MTSNEAQVITDRLQLMANSLGKPWMISPHELKMQIERLIKDVAKMVTPASGNP